ncbi:MAG TPA: MFS transporter [Nitrospirota bacterium]
MKLKTFSALQHRNYRLFFIGQALSLTGTWMHSVAQGWLVLKLTDSAFFLSLVSAVGSLPVLFLSLIGGVVADRVPKRNLILLAQTLSMLLAFSLAMLVALDAIRVWQIIMIAGLLGIVNTFDIPARQAFIVEMVGKEDLMNGIALNSAMFNGARIVGPALAGLLIGYLGLTPCFFINSASYIAIIIGLLMMDIKPTVKREFHPVLKELAEGISYVRNAPSVLWFIVMVAMTSLFAIPYIALMPIFARDILHIGAKGLGLMMGASGVGALVGALTIASFGSVKRKGRTAFMAGIIANLALIGLSFSRAPFLSCLLLMFVGWGMISMLATVNTAIQDDVPDHLRGRVMSLYSLVFLGFTPIGNLIVGAVAHYYGTPFAVALGATICIVTYVLIALSHKELLAR